MVNNCDPDKHHRRSIRLEGYDYSQGGAYFVTLCTQGRQPLFGQVVGERMILNPTGTVVEQCWRWLGKRHSHVELDEWIVMPNHLHGIIAIHDLALGGSQTAFMRRKSLGRLIGAFKTVATNRGNPIGQGRRSVIWQRNYFERIIRDEDELNRVREYISENPARWETDSENPEARVIDVAALLARFRRAIHESPLRSKTPRRASQAERRVFKGRVAWRYAEGGWPCPSWAATTPRPLTRACHPRCGCGSQEDGSRTAATFDGCTGSGEGGSGTAPT
jgi:REP element-mobilizing transposase RayT